MPKTLIRAAQSAVALSLLALPVAAQSQATAPDSGDTSWILTSSALVLMMALPGLALFYGGLVRMRNVLSVFMHCFAIASLVSIFWALVGYSLAFAPGNSVLGGLGNFGLTHLAEVRADTTIPESVFALFQMTFAVITPMLIIGAFVERVRFGWLVPFALLWSLIVYVPVTRWIWGGGWLAELGTLDFAGGIVVHTTAGVSALVLALLIGPRKGFGKSLILPHSPVLTATGAGLLWVGWFGFNGGSALGANHDAGLAILNTHLAASAAALVWILIERVKLGKPTTIGIATGAIAGLATITPAAGFVGVPGALILGLAGGSVCYVAVQFIRNNLGIDDSLDVFAVHGVGGILGSILLAPLAMSLFGGVDYDASANAGTQLVAQLVGVGAVALWSAIVTAVIALGLSIVLPMRVNAESEREGLDLASHAERGWDLD